MQSTIGPEMKVHIKGVTNETTKLVDMKTNGFARNRKPKVSITLLLNMKTISKTSQTRSQRMSQRILRQTKHEPPKGRQEKERAIRRGGMMDRSPKPVADLPLELQTMSWIQFPKESPSLRA